MRVRGLERICLSLLIGLTAIALITPTASLAFGEMPSRRHGDAVPDHASPPDASGMPRQGYTRVLIGPLKIGFTKGFLAGDERSEHRIRGADVERIDRYYREIVTSKLASAYSISPEPGSQVVRLDALLIDHVVDKRDWLAPVRLNFRTAPRVRLIVFLRDSLSEELIDTVGLTLGPRGGRLMKDSPGFYWHYMRRVFDRIATRVLWSLEDTADPS
jgi:hypothetical protein